jgi:hypothetical protein
MSETFFDTCVNWSCVTRCGYRTTSSTLFTVWGLEKAPTVGFLSIGNDNNRLGLVHLSFSLVGRK